MLNIGDRVLEVDPNTFKPYRTLDPGTVVNRDLTLDSYVVQWDGDDNPLEWIHGSLLVEAPADWVPESLFFNKGVDDSE